ncbi:MAG TPA: class I SAM-dependent methyltransferase [Ktedonobacterales bacterium]|nr:class I SAM-dependent methyltransferase [Ktedonobacterales bacterium]
MADQWDNADFARRWDATALVNNPTRAEQLDILVSLIEETYQQGAAILDLGIGSGLVEAVLFARRPDAYIVGVESSAAMIDLAKRRLASFESHYTIIQHDFSDIDGLALPAKEYQMVMSVQALHHITHVQQQKVFQFVANLLPAGGLFLLMERIALDPAHFADIYRSVWNRLERVGEVQSGWTGDYFLQRLEHKEDYPASLEELLAWMREAGLRATCLHLHLDRAFVVGVKK